MPDRSHRLLEQPLGRPHPARRSADDEFHQHSSLRVELLQPLRVELLRLRIIDVRSTNAGFGELSTRRRLGRTRASSRSRLGIDRPRSDRVRKRFRHHGFPAWRPRRRTSQCSHVTRSDLGTTRIIDDPLLARVSNEADAQLDTVTQHAVDATLLRTVPDGAHVTLHGSAAEHHSHAGTADPHHGPRAGHHPGSGNARAGHICSRSFGHSPGGSDSSGPSSLSILNRA